MPFVTARRSLQRVLTTSTLCRIIARVGCELVRYLSGMSKSSLYWDGPPDLTAMRLDPLRTSVNVCREIDMAHVEALSRVAFHHRYRTPFHLPTPNCQLRRYMTYWNAPKPRKTASPSPHPRYHRRRPFAHATHLYLDPSLYLDPLPPSYRVDRHSQQHHVPVLWL